MADGVWRNFRFFEAEKIPPTACPLSELGVVCSTLTPTSLVVGDYEGQVHFFDRHLSPAVGDAGPGSPWRFQAYTGPVTHLRYCALRNSLITIGDDDALNAAILRVWDLDQILTLYNSLQSHPSASSASPGVGTGPGLTPRWWPPCQEHRLLPSNKGVVAGGRGTGLATLGDDLPLVPILLDPKVQRQCHFKATSRVPSPPAPSPTGSPTGIPAAPSTEAPTGDVLHRTGSSGGTISCGAVRSAVLSFDVAPDLCCAVAALITRDCVLLTGDLAKEQSVRILTLRSGIAKGPLTFVGLPSAQWVRLQSVREGGPSGVSEAGGSTSEGGGGGSFPLWSGASHALRYGASAPSAHPQVVFTVYEDAVTCWTLRNDLKYAEHRCPTATGAPPFGATLTAYGELLLLGRSTPSHGLATSRIIRLGPAGPSTASPQAYDPTVASSIQTFDVDHVPGRGALYAHRQYLILLVQHEDRPEQFQLQCLDLTYRIRGLSRPQETYVNCAAVLSDGADVLVLYQDPAVRSKQLALRAVRLREADTQTKLELLFSKECYGIAQQLAQTMEGGDPTLQQRIRKRYADYLYNKGKFNEAMAQYVETIGYVESSYVIRRYMGSARMEQLIRYLEELHHERHHASANVAHTTLLLMCYSKLKDEKRLKSFIYREDVRFDAKNVIDVCRKGGYSEAALYIADRYAAVYDAARIRLYDMQDPLRALSYIRTLGVDEAEQVGARLGRNLLLAAPRATTELLMELCVHWKGPGRRLVDAAVTNTGATSFPVWPADAGMPAAPLAFAIDGEQRHPHRANAATFLHIFVDTPVCLLNFLRAVVESGVLEEEERGACVDARSCPPLPDPDTQERRANTSVAVEVKAGTTASSTSSATFGPHAVLYNTLLELYLTPELKDSLPPVQSRPSPPQRDGPRDDGEGGHTNPSTVPSDPVRREPLHGDDAAASFPHEPLSRRQEQARTFLEAYKGRYDPYLALSLAQQSDFQDGVLYLLHSLGLSQEMLSYFSAKMTDPTATEAERGEAAAKLFEACQASPPADNNTSVKWMMFLSLLLRSRSTAGGVEGPDIVKVLDYIEAHNVLPPVVVLEILSNAPESGLTLRTVRDYCQRCLQRQTRDLQAVLAQTSERLAEAERVKDEVVALQTAAVTFSSPLCAHCHQQLDTPTVYFMCAHAFHYRCLYTPTECNVCAAQHRQQRDAIRETEQRDLQLQQPSSFTAQFFEDVKRGRCAGNRRSAGEEERMSEQPDGFQVVADYVARGVLGAPPLHKDAGLFGYDPAVPLRAGEAPPRETERLMHAEELDVW